MDGKVEEPKIDGDEEQDLAEKGKASAEWEDGTTRATRRNRLWLQSTDPDWTAYLTHTSTVSRIAVGGNPASAPVALTHHQPPLLLTHCH